MPLDHEAIGFTTRAVAEGAAAGRVLTAWGDLTHVSLSDPSGAGIRYTLAPTGEVRCEQPTLTAGDLTQVWVTSATPDPDCVWCSCLEADVRDEDGNTLTRLAFGVSDLAHSLGAWRPDAPTPVRLSLWPQQLETFSSDEQFREAQAAAGGVPWAIGSWLPTGLFGDRARPLASCTGRVEGVSTHVNERTGAGFDLVRVPVPSLGVSVLVPVPVPEDGASRDGTSAPRPAPGDVLQVSGRVRAAYGGAPARLVTRGRQVPWLAQVLGLAPSPVHGSGGPPTHAPRLPPPAPGAGPPDRAVPALVGVASRHEVLLDGVVAATACGVGAAVGVQRAGGRTVAFGAGFDGMTWRRPLEGSFESIGAYDDHAVVVSGGVATVLDSDGALLLRVAPVTQGRVRWVVSDMALWALVDGTGAAGQRAWTVHRVPRQRWERDEAPVDLASVADTWELPPTPPGGPGGRAPSLRIGDTVGWTAVALLPGAGPGQAEADAVAVKIPGDGEALVYRPTPAQLPIAVLDTEVGELITTDDGTWFAGEAVTGLTGPTDPRTSWHPLAVRVVGGEVVAGGPADGARPTRVGVLHLSETGARWHQLEQDHAGQDVRFALDGDDERVVWASTRGPDRTRLSVLDLRSGVERHQDLPVQGSVVAACSGPGRVLLRVDPSASRDGGREAAPAFGELSPGRLVRVHPEVGR